jgi:hypothetical protein
MDLVVAGTQFINLNLILMPKEVPSFLKELSVCLSKNGFTCHVFYLFQEAYSRELKEVNITDI